MNIAIRIRRNSDGVERVAVQDFDPAYGDPLACATYMFKEGNYSCDCNLHIFFQEAGGEEPDEEDFGCSDYKYTVVNLEEAKEPTQ